MELLLELFITIIFSFLVAKLLSIPVSNLGLNSTKILEEEIITEEVKFDRGGLECEDTQTKRRFQNSLVEKSCQEETVTTSQNEGEVADAPGSEETDGDEYRGEREGEKMNPAMEELIVNVDVRANPLSEVENENNQIDKELVSENNDDDDDDDDDWEGIERSELEKVFAKAANYVGVGLLNLESDVQMHFYGLHKIAMEGPCREPQPMAFKITARAKWNAWRRMGNITPDAAMEQYIALLSTKDPTWREGHCYDNKE